MNSSAVSARHAPVAWVDSEPGTALRTYTLEPIHHDPMNRRLVAQSQVLDLTLITDDPWIQRYPVMWLAASSWDSV